jgi:hypothetical protein
MTKLDNENIIEFVKRTHDDFEDDNISKDRIEQMMCHTYKEWCKMIVECDDFSITPLVKKYFNFQQLLNDKWQYSASMGDCEYYLVRLEEGDLKLIDNQVELNMYHTKCWIVTIPTH